jgi:hypothetical protein
VQVLPAREVYDALQREYRIVATGGKGDVLLFHGKSYRYSLDMLQKINSSADPIDRLQVWQVTTRAGGPGRPMLAGRDVCRITYRAPETGE